MTELAGWATQPARPHRTSADRLAGYGDRGRSGRMLRRDPAAVVTVSTGLYIAGTVTLVAAFLTGRSAAPEVYTPGMAQAIVARHWDWALWCVWYFGLLTAGRVGLRFAAGAPRRTSTVALAVAGLAGLVLLTNTAELGGRLVYQHGVGVAAPVARNP